MMEDNTIKAILIGVSTFIAIITISAVMMYYNTAKKVVQDIGTGVDLSGNYSEYIRNLLIKPNGSEISGNDVKNILNYYYNDENVKVIFDGLKAKNTSSGTVYGDKSEHTLTFNNHSFYNYYYGNIISESKFEINVEYEPNTDNKVVNKITFVQK